MADPDAKGRWKSEEYTDLARAEGHDSWMAWIEAIEEEKGHEICGAKAKSTEAPCRKPYAEDRPRGRCKSHGGGSRVGVAAPNYQHGRRASPEYTLPQDLLPDVERFIRQSPARTLQENKAVLGHLRNALLEEALAQAGPELKRQLEEIFAEIRDTDDRDQVRTLFGRAYRLVSEGVESGEARDRLMGVLAELRKTSDAQRRLFVDLHEVIEKPKFLAMVDRIARWQEEAVEEALTADRVRTAIERGDDLEDVAERLRKPILAAFNRRVARMAGAGPSRNGGEPRAGREIEV